MVDVALYNNEKVLVSKKHLRVGDYVELKPTNKLYFCCMEVPSPSGIDFKVADIFSQGCRSSISEEEVDFSDAEFSHLTKIDLNNFPDGLDVDLKEDKLSGMLTFVPKPKYN